MSYTPQTFVADEQPTTAKWNLLWSNDASFNDGTGIGDNAILERHLNFDVTTDANGWDVLDFGAIKFYTKRFNGITTASSGPNAGVLTTGGGGSGLAFPSGIGPTDCNWLVDGQTDDGAARWKFFMDQYDEDGNSSTTFSLYARNLTTATITMTGGTAMVIGIQRT